MTNRKAQQVGKIVKQYRKERGFTQAQLAAKAKLSANTIARLERGEHDATLPTLEGIAKVLGIKLSTLIDL